MNLVNINKIVDQTKTWSGSLSTSLVSPVHGTEHFLSDVHTLKTRFQTTHFYMHRNCRQHYYLQYFHSKFKDAS